MECEGVARRSQGMLRAGLGAVRSNLCGRSPNGSPHTQFSMQRADGVLSAGAGLRAYPRA